MKKAYGTALLVLELIGLALLVAMTVIILINWGEIPERIPAHISPSGVADAWQSKFSLLKMPLIGAGVYVLLSVLCIFTRRLIMPVPVSDNNREQLYGVMRLALAALKMELAGGCCYITYYTIQIKPLPALFLLTFIIVLALTLIAFSIAIHRLGKKT